MKMEEMTLELDSDLLEKVQELLVPYEMTPEELVAAFIRWCADNPVPAMKALRQWQAEDDKGEY